MHFQRLRLSGFKSFVDATEFRIEPGVTGIVGPNGCGKSNLLEALRWVMGANSAKAMRAGGMDDVIFAGTSERPARNHAEVSLTIDNADRRAPEPFRTWQLFCFDPNGIEVEMDFDPAEPGPAQVEDAGMMSETARRMAPA